MMRKRWNANNESDIELTSGFIFSGLYEDPAEILKVEIVRESDQFKMIEILSPNIKRRGEGIYSLIISPYSINSSHPVIDYSGRIEQEKERNIETEMGQIGSFSLSSLPILQSKNQEVNKDLYTLLLSEDYSLINSTLLSKGIDYSIDFDNNTIDLEIPLTVKEKARINFWTQESEVEWSNGSYIGESGLHSRDFILSEESILKDSQEVFKDTYSNTVLNNYTVINTVSLLNNSDFGIDRYEMKLDLSVPLGVLEGVRVEYNTKDIKIPWAEGIYSDRWIFAPTLNSNLKSQSNSLTLSNFEYNIDDGTLDTDFVFLLLKKMYVKDSKDWIKIGFSPKEIFPSGITVSIYTPQGHKVNEVMDVFVKEGELLILQSFEGYQRGNYKIQIEFNFGQEKIISPILEFKII